MVLRTNSAVASDAIRSDDGFEVVVPIDMAENPAEVRPTGRSVAANSPTADGALSEAAKVYQHRQRRNTAIIAFGIMGFLMIGLGGLVFVAAGARDKEDEKKTDQVAKMEPQTPVPLPPAWKEKSAEPDPGPAPLPSEAALPTKEKSAPPPPTTPSRPGLPELGHRDSEISPLPPPVPKAEPPADRPPPTARSARPKVARVEDEDDPSSPKSSPPKAKSTPAPTAKAPAPSADEANDGDVPVVDAKSELKRLQGTWSIYRSESGSGTEVPAPHTNLIIIDGDTLTWMSGGANNGSAHFTIAVDKDPKEIDVVLGTGGKQQGIYRWIKDGQLEISWSGVSGMPKRPRKFTGRLTPGAGWIDVIYRGENYKDPPEIAKEMKKFQGRWIPHGQPTAPVMIEDDLMTFYWGGNQVGREGRFSIDPSKSPKELDLIYSRGYPGRRMLGIYRVTADKLEICLGPMDASKRPTKFADAKSPGGGDQYYSLELQEK